MKSECCDSKQVGYIEIVHGENIKEVGLICMNCGNMAFNEVPPEIQAVPVIREIGFYSQRIRAN